MKARDFDRAVSAACDLLVIGGTFQGLAIAREAALAGLRTTLVEPLDFGSDGSSYHLQIVPGGLHLLRRGKIRGARRAIRARRRLARTAPWLIRPLPFLAATVGGLPASRLLWRGIFKVDDWLGRHRNAGVEPELHLPPARLVSRTATLRLFPGVRREGLTGGIQWYDYQILDGHRFAVALAAGAEAEGAELLNHVDVLEVLREGNRIAGARIRDATTGAEAVVRASLVIYAAAGHVDLRRLFGISPPPANLRHLTAMTPKPASDMALTASVNGGRLVLMPSKGHALVGSTEPIAAHATSPVTETDPGDFIARANESFPALGLSRADIVSLQATIDVDMQGPAVVMHQGGAMVVTSSNAAAALDAASLAVRKAAKTISKSIRLTRADRTLPGAGIADHEALLIESAKKLGVDVPADVMRHLLPRYAEAAASFVHLIAADRQLMRPLVDDHPHIAAEVVHAVRHEKAVRLDDILLRRLGLSEASSRSSNVRRAAGALAAQELGWDQARLEAEIDAPAGRITAG